MKPLEYIKKLMSEQGVEGDPKKHIVLLRWNKIITRVGAYEMSISTPPRPLKPGLLVYAATKVDSPGLTQVEVVDDRGDSLWVKSIDVDVHFSVPFDCVHFTAIPLVPTVIHKEELWKYIGKEAVAKLKDHVKPM